MTHDTTPAKPAPQLVGFEPCDDWWAVWFVRATDHHGAAWRREPVAGWGIHLGADGNRFVVAMVTDGEGCLVTASDANRSVHLFRSRSAYCNCYDPDGDNEDWSWCPECGAEIFGRVNP